MATTFLLRAASGVLAIASLMPTYLASTAANNLMKYESTTKKAAKWSAEAERQLWKTRYTQGAAILASGFSVASAFYVMLRAPSDTFGILLAVINLVSCSAAQRYLANFWKGSARVPLPGSGQYNDAVRATEQVMPLLLGLVGGWAAICGLTFLSG